MAEIVAALGVPHTPIFPFQVQTEGPQSETAQLFAKMTVALRAARPDAIVIFDTDHLNTCFLDNLPIFAIGVTDTFKGPNDEPRGVPVYTIKSLPGLAAHIRERTVKAGFDVALLQAFSVDHSVAVPFHFMTPQMDVPVIPIFIGGHVPPLPLARRCFDLGHAVKAAIEAWPEPLRVVVIGTGSFSLEVWGPRIAPGRTDGVPDPEWVDRICNLIEDGDTEALIAESTEEKMLGAGNVAGELLNWIAMLAFVGGRRPNFLAKQKTERPCLRSLELTMSTYAVNHLCRELLRDHDFRARMKADPAQALASLDLTQAERAALLAGDVAALYGMGVNAFLMGYLARFEVCGLSLPVYNERIRTAAA